MFSFLLTKLTSLFPITIYQLFFFLLDFFFFFSFPLYHAEIKDKQLKNNDDFIWAIDVPLTGKFIIDVEFLDLKIASPCVSSLHLCLLISQVYINQTDF